MNAYQKFNRLAEQVTNEVIAELQQGKVIWQKPWSSHGLPRNYASGRPYEGFNAFYLNHVTEQNNYAAPCFFTFKQARELGGRVRKGQKGTPIVYWKIYEAKAKEQPVDLAAEGEDRPCSRFVPFVWNVFNIDQVEGVDFRLPAMPQRSGPQLLQVCQHVVDSFPQPGPKILHGGTQAYYAPARDMVQLPAPERFLTPEAYYATLFHELIHATGHYARLNRFAPDETPDRFGDEAYSKEELIAEMGASFLCAHAGIRQAVFQNAVAYLQGWISRLREDSTMILYAATRAFKAASYILNLKAEYDKGAPLANKQAA